MSLCAGRKANDKNAVRPGAAPIARDGTPTDGIEAHSFAFQRVELASSTFVRGFTYVRFGHSMLASGNEFQKPETMAATSLRFAGTKIAPGDYALVAHTVHQNLGTMTLSNVNCYALGAAIYRFREGAINIVRLGKSSDFAARLSRAAGAVEVDDPVALQAQVTEVLAGYPNMTAPSVVARLLGTASFETAKKTCTTPAGFSFTRWPGVSVDW